MKFKYIFLSIVTLLQSLYISATEIISPIVIQDGEAYEYTHVFECPECMSFFLIDKNLSGIWKISFLNVNNQYSEIVNQNSDANGLEFRPSEFSWFWAKRIYDAKLRRELIEIIVSYISDNGDSESKRLLLGLTPTKPILSNFSFEYEYDWEWDEIWPNGYLWFDVESKDAISYEINFSRSFRFDPPDFFEFCMGFDAEEKSRIGYDADWGEFFYIGARNRYGAIFSDTLCTTSFITDEKVLNRINEIRDMASVKSLTNEPNIEYSFQNNVITFTPAPSETTVYNTQGNVIIHCINESSIDLTNYSKGIYIVTIIDDKKNRMTIKIINQ